MELKNDMVVVSEKTGLNNNETSSTTRNPIRNFFEVSADGDEEKLPKNNFRDSFPSSCSDREFRFSEIDCLIEDFLDDPPSALQRTFDKVPTANHLECCNLKASSEFSEGDVVTNPLLLTPEKSEDSLMGRMVNEDLQSSGDLLFLPSLLLRREHMEDFPLQPSYPIYSVPPFLPQEPRRFQFSPSCFIPARTTTPPAVTPDRPMNQIDVSSPPGKSRGRRPLLHKVSILFSEENDEVGAPAVASFLHEPVSASTKERIPATKKSHGASSSRFRVYQAQSWTIRLEEARLFLQEEGHCRIPHEYLPNNALASWAKRQRFQYKRFSNKDSSTRNSFLTLERIQMLDELGFVWDLQAKSWDDRFEELREYVSQHGGNADVPSAHPDNKKLAIWVKCQRRQYKLRKAEKRTTISIYRVALLESVGFNWATKKAPGAKRVIEY
jgi:hypothetical protein